MISDTFKTEFNEDLILNRSSERILKESFKEQIAYLEKRYCALVPITSDGKQFSKSTAKILSLEELEMARLALIEKITLCQRQAASRAIMQEKKRVLVEEMLLAPEKFPFVKVSYKELGQKGCGSYHSLPRFGIVGLFLNWWRVKISSGCP